MAEHYLLNQASVQVNRCRDTRVNRFDQLLGCSIQQVDRHIRIDVGGVIIGRLGLRRFGLGVVLGIDDTGWLAGWLDADGLNALNRFNRKRRVAGASCHRDQG